MWHTGPTNTLSYGAMLRCATKYGYTYVYGCLHHTHLLCIILYVYIFIKHTSPAVMTQWSWDEVFPSPTHTCGLHHHILLCHHCQRTPGGWGGEHNWLPCSYQWESHLHCGGTAGSERRTWTRGAARTKGREGSKRNKRREGSERRRIKVAHKDQLVHQG